MIESELPNGWLQIRVGEVSVQLRGVSYGKNDASSLEVDGKVLILRGGNIQDGKIFYNDDHVYVDKSFVKDVQLIKAGDVIIVSSTGSKQLIGKAAHAKTDLPTVSFGAFLTMLRPNKHINYLYFDYFFHSDYYRQSIRELSGGVNINNIRNEHLQGLYFPLAPLAEQKRIVAKLDAAFNHLNIIRVKLERIPELLKSFRQTVLSHAVTGKLTEKWREENIERLVSAKQMLDEIVKKREAAFILKNKKINKKLHKPSKPNYLNYSIEDDSYEDSTIPNKWLVAKVGLLCDCIVPGRDKPKSFTGNIPWITLPDLTKDEIDSNDGQLKLSLLEIDEVNARIIPEESVIMSCIGRFGISAYIKEAVVINQQLHAFLKSDLIAPKYLMYSIRNSESYFSSISTSTTISYLNKTNCNSLPVNLPPLEEQLEIIRQVEALLDKASALESSFRSLKEKIDVLPQALLAKAFRGQLVEQDENDEPASVLLEKIQKSKPRTKNENQKPLGFRV